VTTCIAVVVGGARPRSRLLALNRAAVGTYALGVTTTAERLRDARVKTDSALARVRADPGASPVLIAVVNEFASKAEKAAHHGDERTAVIELEQAGDSAKAAAEADTGVADTTRQAVLDAHLAICIAKTKL
jgi:type IV secretory pathway VirJ component